jgi:isoleucyl-tRNA synthetase
MDFYNIENDIISFWQQYDLDTKIKLSRTSYKWEFLDGPPFVNGTPHYGHLLVSTIKDTMARYMSQKGFQISYQIGFDCHGLPLEQEAEKYVGKVQLTDTTKLSIFNDKCRDIISNCSEIWFQSLGRLGRQFDKSQTYYTSDFKYMESLWWAFKQLWDKKLIYCSKKVMPYSPLCETPLSNFEANSNYQDRTDISVFVKFNIIDSDESLLVWTTTPWSLFANQGICVNPDLNYQLIELQTKDSTHKLWICQDIVDKFCVGEFSSYTILKTVIGSSLLGIKYSPIFPLPHWTNYQVYCDNYVQSTSGTGIVHLAPLFGEDDMRVLKKYSYSDSDLPNIVDTQMKFIIHFDLGYTDIHSRFLIDTSTDICIFLKTKQLALKSEKIKHSYPYCWRTDHPLIYYATDAWFMNVQQIIPDIIEGNKQINWYPSYVGTERFANWIKDAPDWCLSRNRIWGTPIPVWCSDSDCICIGSVKELEQYTGKTFTDIHLDKIGDVTFTHNGKTYSRTFGVLDCWFESGMARISRFGFPDCQKYSQPVDFIAESLDQTRGWFYTLNVLSIALHNQPAFKNVIVSGLILASDGRKMSKRLSNYTNPDIVIQKYGADILRLYLLSSPATKAESFCFKDTDLTEITRKMLPYYNAHNLLNECITFSNTIFTNFSWFNDYILIKSTNKLDLWIINKFYEFSKNVYSHMEKLELAPIPNLIFKFIDSLTNFYIKLSRDRMKCQLTDIDCKQSLSTLFNVLKNTNILLAPFIPHIVEKLSINLHLMTGQHMSSYSSVHLQFIDIQPKPIDQSLLNGFYSITELFENVRTLRQQISKPIYYPLNRIILYTDSSDIINFTDVICSELNIKEMIVYDTSTITKVYKSNRSILGKIFKKDAHKISQLIDSGNISWEGCTPQYYTIDLVVDHKDHFIGSKFEYLDSLNTCNQAIVYLDTTTSHINDMEAEINNIRRQVNAIRKDMGLKIFNKVQIIFENSQYWACLDKDLIELLKNRLIATVTFQHSELFTDFKIINTFNGKQIKVIINPI